jgi:hypothetical protein
MGTSLDDVRRRLYAIYRLGIGAQERSGHERQTCEASIDQRGDGLVSAIVPVVFAKASDGGVAVRKRQSEVKDVRMHNNLRDWHESSDMHQMCNMHLTC